MSNWNTQRAVIEHLEDRRLFNATGAVDVPTPAAPPDAAAPAAEAPLDTTGPQIVGVRVVGGPFHAEAIQITFSEPLNPGRAENRDNYVVGGKFVADAEIAFFDELPDDDLFFDPDDVRLRLPIDEAIYDGSTNTVTLVPDRTFSVLRLMRVVKVRSGEDGIKDLAGNTLDGDKDGRAGGVAVMRYKSTFGKNVKYIDQDGDKVKLSLRGGGRVYVLQELNPHRNASSGQAVQVWLTERVKVTSVLRGSVAPTSRGGDGRATIRELLWTEPAQLDVLDDERFTFGEVSR